MKTYDVIVIGAGPAGAVNAETVSSSGFSTLIIDKKKEIGVPLQCGEAITSFCLKDTGLTKDYSYIKNEVKGVKVIFPNKTFFYSSEKRLNIDRKKFDKFLVEAALTNGAVIKLKTKMKNIKKKGKHWEVYTNKDLFRGRIVIGADGPLSKTAKQLGLLSSQHYLIGLQYKFKSKFVKNIDDEWLIMYMDPSLSGGYKWVFPRGDQYNIGLGGFSVNINDLNKFCKTLGIDHTKKEEINGGLLPYNFKFITRSLKNCFIIGDAAGLTNPATGGGIHAALYSGKLSAQYATHSLTSENFNIAKNYDKKLMKTPFLHSSHLKASEYLQKWTENDWNLLGEIVNGLEMNDLTMFKCLKIALENPKLLLRAKELLTIRKSMKINKKYS